jgi:hypothetical protein
MHVAGKLTLWLVWFWCAGAARAAERGGEVFVQFEIPANADVLAESHRAGKAACTAGIEIGGACLLSESEARHRSGNPNRGKGRGFGYD